MSSSLSFLDNVQKQQVLDSALEAIEAIDNVLSINVNFSKSYNTASTDNQLMATGILS